jgi:hypothetical protein
MRVIQADGAPRPGSRRRLGGRAEAGGAHAGADDGAGRDTAALLFAAEMYGLQLDQLATVLGVSGRRASEIAARWAERGQAQAGRLSPGPRWVWLTKSGLASCGLPYTASPPALSRLGHMRAVTAARLALEAVPGYAAAGGHWRSERRLRARLGGRLGGRDHLPDAEVHWPEHVADDAAGNSAASAAAPGSPAGPGPGSPAGRDGNSAVAWAGECWAIEVELTAKTVSRTTAIMRELLARTGDYGCAAADARVPGRPPRHARVIYLCSPAAARTVGRARDAVGGDAARIEIRGLPPDSYLAAPPTRRGRP